MEKFENLCYLFNSKNKRHQLDIYTPLEDGEFPVLVFIHGGSWYNGCKEMYERLGINLSKKKVVTVIINYRLGAEANFVQMAMDCASALKWTYENIQTYKGQRENIFVAGHSAGGHLSALITLDEKYFKGIGITSPVKGCILIDAFGLNIDYVMFNNHSFFVKELQKVFTKEPKQWKEAAPVTYVQGSTLPFLILVGSETYPYLTMDNEVFKMNLEQSKSPIIYKTIAQRNHVQMITALEHPNDPVYDDLIQFVDQYSFV